MRPELEHVCAAWGDPVRALCAPLKIDPNIALAMITRETAGNPFALRYEPTYRYLVNPRIYAENLLISAETEQVCQMSSWGLMQVMGGVARELGYDDHLTKLTDPERGLKYALQQLARKIRAYPLESDWIAAYNQGDTRKTPGGMYMNQVTYVDPVYSYLKELRALA